MVLIAGKEAEWKGKVGEEMAGPGVLRTSLKLPGRIMQKTGKSQVLVSFDSKQSSNPVWLWNPHLSIKSV